VLGLAIHTPDGLLVAATGGLGIGGLRGIHAYQIPMELTIEMPFGPLRFLGRAALGWRVAGPYYGNKAFGGADELGLLFAIRLGRDVPYWAKAVAGSGPYLGASYRNLGGSELYGIALGVDLFGAD
jgi:hypothetical protein